MKFKKDWVDLQQNICEKKVLFSSGPSNFEI